MSVAVTRSSACPPLCQLLGALCYSPALCSVSRRLPPQRRGPQSALGALWIVTGILHIGLGTILLTTWSYRYRLHVIYGTGCSPVWLGVLFMFFGVFCVLTEGYSRPVVVLLSGLLKLTGAALSITAIVFYSVELDHPGFWLSCGPFYEDWWYGRVPITAPDQVALRERCVEAYDLQRALSFSIFAARITLSVLGLCLGISSATLSFKSLKQGNKSGDTPLLKDATATTQEE